MSAPPTEGITMTFADRFNPYQYQAPKTNVVYVSDGMRALAQIALLKSQPASA